MRNKTMDLVSFTEARTAESIDELFTAMPENFATYMDEKYHWDPETPVNARHAGFLDAIKSPPKPDAASKSPLDTEYISALYQHAQSFLEVQIQACREAFDRMKERASGHLPPGRSPFWNGELVNAEELRDAIIDRERKRDDCETYANENKHLIGNRILHPTPRSPVIFICLVIFIVVFEFVWVWYFLSGELGLSAAVNVSMAAATVVLLISGLSAWSLAITAKDVDDKWKRAMGYLGIVLCVSIFLFGLGLLSAWRSDSTSEGIGYIVDGYRALTNIDVFVTALVNLAGVILLTHELGRFLWPYPLYHYGSRARELADSEGVLETKKRELNEKLLLRKREISVKEARIRELIEEVQKFGNNTEQYLWGGVREINRRIAENQSAYMARNAELRTIDVYPVPVWYSNRASRPDVCTEAIANAISDTVAYIQLELGMTGGGGKTWKSRMDDLLLQKTEEALVEVNTAQDVIDGITGNGAV